MVPELLAKITDRRFRLNKGCDVSANIASIDKHRSDEQIPAEKIPLVGVFFEIRALDRSFNAGALADRRDGKPEMSRRVGRDNSYGEFFTRHIKTRELPLQKRICPIPDHTVFCENRIKIFRHVSCGENAGRRGFKKLICFHPFSDLNTRTRKRRDTPPNAGCKKQSVVFNLKKMRRRYPKRMLPLSNLTNLRVGHELETMVDTDTLHKFSSLRPHNA